MKLRKENEARRNRENLATANMTDSYIRKLLKADGILKGIDIPQELIEAKREHLMLVRAIKEAKKCLK